MMSNLTRKIATTALTLALAFVFASAAQAQRVNGVVRDAVNKEPLLGASVIIKGTTNGVTTDNQGKFTIVAPSGSVLSVGSLGYLTQEVTVRAQTFFEIELSEDALKVDQVVVIGYGTTTQKEITGSVASLKSEDFNQGTFTTAAGILQGKVAGLSVVNPSGGDPNAQFELLLRGTNTMMSGQGPLIIIDGVAGADIRNINFQEVESVDVLKDGSAAAIYGTRGTNGVVIITTKRAKSGVTQVEYDGQWSIQSIARIAEPMSAEEFRWTITNYAPGASSSLYDGDTDWLREITRTPFSQKHSFAVSGGSEKFSHRTVLNVEMNQGIQKRNDSDKYLVKTNIRQSAFENWLDLNYNLSFSKRKYSPAINSAFEQAFMHNPTESVYDPADFASGGYSRVLNTVGYYNPVAMINERDAERQADDVGASVRATLNILPVKGLKWDNFLAYTQQRYESREYRTDYYPSMIGAGGMASISNEYSNSVQFESTFNYTRTFLGKHNLQAVAGYAYEKAMFQSSYMMNQDFDFDVWGTNNIRAGAFLRRGQGEMDSYKESNTYISYFGRAMYNYDEKYLASVSFRNDGSTRFGENNRWGFFPAVSAGWRISQEEFMQDVRWVNELKFRVGYGVTGNQDIPSYRSQFLMSTSGYYYYNGQWQNAYMPAQNPNPDLGWEEKAEFNMGLDFSLLAGRVGGTIDYYSRNTYNLLNEYDVPVPPNYVPWKLANVGDLTNKGIEITLNAIPVKNRDFRWNTTLTFSRNTNKLNKFTNEEFANTTSVVGWLNTPMGVNCQRIIAGESLGTFYAPIWDGLDSRGRDQFVGAVGSSVPPETKWKRVGSAYPDFVLGWSNTLAYKNWDLNIMARASIGGKIFNSYNAYYQNIQNIGLRNVLSSWLDGQPFMGPPVYSSKYIEDATYFKIDNISLGYNLDFKSPYIERMRISFTAQNILCITDYTGVDPEVSLSGLTPGIESLSYYPRTSVFTLGINVLF